VSVLWSLSDVPGVITVPLCDAGCVFTIISVQSHNAGN
jgi:hypothetical protein